MFLIGDGLPSFPRLNSYRPVEGTEKDLVSLLFFRGPFPLPPEEMSRG